MSDDDLFSRLFELFDQPGPINWKLAAEVSHHLVGERVPVEPWVAEEYRELARLAEYRLEEAGVPVAPAPDVVPVDAREWADRHLEAYGYLSEPLSHHGVDLGPLTQLAPALVGMQVGSLVGGLARWVLSSFDGGLPLDRPLPLSLIVPHVESFASRHGFDKRSVRLWAITEEVAFRAVSAIPFVADHLRHLLGREAETIELDPGSLSGLLGVNDPAAAQEEVAASLQRLFGGEETRRARADTSAFLGLCCGYARLLGERSSEELIPERDRFIAARAPERRSGEIPFGPVPPSSAEVAAGRSFCLEVERRYGADALTRMWSAPERIPSATEIADPVGWAARVLLEDF